MKNKPIKFFQYDVLIEKDDICDREAEIAALIDAAKKNKKIVLLAPRRYGKTSLVKNVVGNAMKSGRPKRLVLSVDFMEAHIQGASAPPNFLNTSAGVAKSRHFLGL